LWWASQLGPPGGGCKPLLGSSVPWYLPARGHCASAGGQTGQAGQGGPQPSKHLPAGRQQAWWLVAHQAVARGASPALPGWVGWDWRLAPVAKPTTLGCSVPHPGQASSLWGLQPALWGKSSRGATGGALHPCVTWGLHSLVMVFREVHGEPGAVLVGLVWPPDVARPRCALGEKHPRNAA